MNSWILIPGLDLSVLVLRARLIASVKVEALGDLAFSAKMFAPSKFEASQGLTVSGTYFWVGSE